LLTQYYLELMI